MIPRWFQTPVRTSLVAWCRRSSRAAIDDVLCYNAEQAARSGDAAHAIALLKRIKSPRRFILTSCRVAVALVEKSESD